MSRARRAVGLLHPRWWAPTLITVIVLGFAWQWAADRWPYLLAPLGEIWAILRDQPQFFLEQAWVTLSEAMLGLAIGFVVAFVLAILISELPTARRAVMPIAVVLNVTPLVAIAPALVVAFGFGPGPKLILTSLICFFPILINTSIGLRTVPLPVLHVYRTVHASRLEVLRHLRVPHSLPYIFAALQIVFPLSVIGAVVAELNAAGSSDGLGTTIQVATSMNHLATVWAAIFVLAAMGSLLLLLVTVVERRVLHWHESTQTSH
jgi:NitT/TauT family transport system permease protein